MADSRNIIIHGIIFDLDGVLCSTDRYHYLAWKQIADEAGIYFDETINHRLRGVSRMESLEIILERSNDMYTDAEKNNLAEKKNSIYKRLLNKMTPQDVSQDVRDTLQYFQNEGIPLAVGSSSKNTKFILEQTDLKKYFCEIADGTDITKSKPDPEVFLVAAKKLNLSSCECIVVEDAVAGIEAAHRGGFLSVGIGAAAQDCDCMWGIEKLSDLCGLSCVYEKKERL